MDFDEDPRLHMCIVCASISCPDLRNETYDPATLEDQMSDQMRQYLSNGGKGALLDRVNAKIKLSMIYSWFDSDFKDHDPTGNHTVLGFLLQFFNTADKLYIQQNLNAIKITYFSYDWDLNGKLSAICQSPKRVCFPWWGLLGCIGGVVLIGVILYCVVRRKHPRNYQSVQ